MPEVAGAHQGQGRFKLGGALHSCARNGQAFLARSMHAGFLLEGFTLYNSLQTC